MTCGAGIVQMIEARKCVAAAVGMEANLYTDLAFDSLAFTDLLVKIEDAFSISFEISEMEQCLWVKNLIALVDQKVKDVGGA